MFFADTFLSGARTPDIFTEAVKGLQTSDFRLWTFNLQFTFIRASQVVRFRGVISPRQSPPFPYVDAARYLLLSL